jgi:hypothetical protein
MISYDELKNNLEGSSSDLIGVQSRKLPLRTEENNEKSYSA